MTGPETGTQAAPAAGQRLGRPGTDERTARRAVTRAYRPRRRVAAVIVAALLALAAILVAIEVIAALFDGPVGLLPVEGLASLGQDTAWTDPLAVALAILAVLVGLWLLVLAIRPGKVRAVPLASDRPDTVVAAGQGSVERVAAAAAETVDGVDRAGAQADRNRITVRVDTPLHDPGDLARQVREVVTDRVGRLEPMRAPRIRVNVRNRKG